MEIKGRVRLADLTPLSSAGFDRAVQICRRISTVRDGRADYIRRKKIDPEIALPAANWEEGCGNDFVAAYRFVADNPRYEVVNNLRFYTQFFTGYNLRTLSSGRGKKSIAEVPRDWDAVLDEAHPEPDLWVHRYLEMMKAAPPELAVTVPKMMGEIGWDVSGITVSHDLCVYQERLNLLYEAGMIDELRRKAKKAGSVNILEIGGGFGGLAHLLRQVVPQVNYFICDLPESLLFSSLYLGIVYPDLPHTLYDGADPRILKRNDRGFKSIPNFMFDDLVAVHPRFDLAVNTLSFSEMSAKQVRYYARQLKKLLGRKGVLFEQNQDNRSFGLIDCKEYLGDYFAKRETLETTSMPGLTQGTADFWSNRRGKMQRPPGETPEVSCVGLACSLFRRAVEGPRYWLGHHLPMVAVGRPLHRLVQGMRRVVPRALQVLRKLLGDAMYQRLRAHWHALRGR
jgi:putative sugar O-methyltransferase